MNEPSRSDSSDYEDTIRKLESAIDDLETENWGLSEFVDFVDKTNPELRVAYEAAQKLEGANT